MLNKLISLLLLVLIGILIVPSVYAHEDSQAILDSVKYEKVNPSDGFNYGLKRFQEKLGFILVLSKAKKADHYLKSIDKRLAELRYTIENKDMANFEDATTRYFSTVGQYVDYLNTSKVSFNKDKVVHKFSEHKVVLAYLRDKFQFEQAEYRFVQDDINYLQTYQDKLP